jgi:hypothetical protein
MLMPGINAKKYVFLFLFCVVEKREILDQLRCGVFWRKKSWFPGLPSRDAAAKTGFARKEAQRVRAFEQGPKARSVTKRTVSTDAKRQATPRSTAATKIIEERL